MCILRHSVISKYYIPEEVQRQEIRKTHKHYDFINNIPHCKEIVFVVIVCQNGIAKRQKKVRRGINALLGETTVKTVLPLF